MIAPKPKSAVCQFCKVDLGKGPRTIIRHGWACPDCTWLYDHGENCLTPEDREAITKERRKRGPRVPQERLFDAPRQGGLARSSHLWRVRPDPERPA